MPSAALLRARRLLALAALSTVAAATSAQPRYALTDLGQLPGTVNCWPSGLNNQGDVVGYCAPAIEDFNQTGFVWRAGTMTGTGRLAGGNYSVANAINSAGTVVGDGDTGNIRPQSWVRKGSGGLVNFFPNNGGNTHALFVADAGWIGGYYTKSLGGWVSSWKGAIWTQDTKDPRKWRVVDLPALPGVDPKSTSAIPSAFNQRGQAAGYASNDQIGQHAALWNADATRSIVDLGVYPGDWSSVAYGINDLGQVVGSSHPPFGSRPVLWDNDAAHTAVELPVLAGDNQGSATAVNVLGHVLGASWYGTPGTWDRTAGRSVLWRDGGVFALTDLLDPASAAGCSVSMAIALNNVGQIAAVADCGGRSRAVLLTPLN